ncbi:hypothetical protein [Actinomadura sp. 6N118]|uniref:hypothetical protein n=1 Tax=Actinomadura sp. 6N118 TaxID=3375151 RepID=UPI0037AE318B
MTDALVTERKPVHVLSIVMDAFEEAAKARLHPRLAQMVRSFAFEEAETHLKHYPKTDATLAIRQGFAAVRPVLRRYLSQHGVLNGTASDVIDAMEASLYFLTTSGPEVDPPPPPPLEVFEAAIRHMLKTINTTLVDEPFAAWPGHLRLTSAEVGPFFVVWDEHGKVFRWATDDPHDSCDDEIICGLDDLMNGVCTVANHFGMPTLPQEPN